MGQKILIIEDSSEMSENISELLTLAGYDVIRADNGRHGLELAKSKHPDLILCDIMMPDLDGYGVLRAIENLPELAGVPFIFVTAKSEKNDFRKGMNLGADDYLPKPFEGDDLLNIVAVRLKKGRQIRKMFENSLEGLNEFIEKANTVLGTDIFSENRIEKKLRKKDVVFMEGDSSVCLYFVSSGKIKTYRTNENGKEYITGIYKKGDFFGYLTLIDNHARRDSAMAMENSEIVLISRQDFQKLIFSNNDVALHFIRFMSNNLEEAEERLLKLAYNSARKRVAEALLFIHKKYEAKEGESILVSRENISMLAGISPESASRSLTDFREEGLIETENGSIKIVDVVGLENLKW